MRFLLNNVSGEAKPGKLLAIMGPSGSGKTTLLNVLAGQVVASPRLHLSGLLEVNGKPSSNKAYKLVFLCLSNLVYLMVVLYILVEFCLCVFRSAFVRQEDLFFSQLTVRETLSLAAELQLPELSSVEKRDEYVTNLLFKLGLVCQELIEFDVLILRISDRLHIITNFKLRTGKLCGFHHW